MRGYDRHHSNQSYILTVVIIVTIMSVSSVSSSSLKQKLVLTKRMRSVECPCPIFEGLPGPNQGLTVVRGGCNSLCQRLRIEDWNVTGHHIVIRFVGQMYCIRAVHILRQPKSGAPGPPLPPPSAMVSICLTPLLYYYFLRRLVYMIKWRIFIC